MKKHLGENLVQEDPNYTTLDFLGFYSNGYHTNIRQG